jgi:putative transposase
MRKTKNDQIKEELLDELLDHCESPEKLLESDFLQKLKRQLVNRALEAEMTHHLGYDKHDPKGNGSGNSRNGKTTKKVNTSDNKLEIDVPRDRKGNFNPQIVKKFQRRINGFDDKILSMYTRGMSVRDIQGHLEEIYGMEVSADLISEVTDEVVEEVKAWQNRPLDRVYPIVYLDALVVKMRNDGRVENRAVYLALGVNMSGQKEALGLWVSANEGAKFWLQILTELKNRGVEDILIACVDGLNGFTEAIESVYPKTETQLCIVHMIRNSLKYVSYKDRKELVGDLKCIYKATTEEVARDALAQFREKWDERYPLIGELWERNWSGIIPFLAYPQEIRKAIYTTNAIESLNRTLRKSLKTKSIFPNEMAAKKLIYLSLQKAAKKWTMPIRNWTLAIHQFSIRFPKRLDPFLEIHF